jgi:hypothetical protein
MLFVMRNTVAAVLVAVGLVVALAGVGSALSELVGLYSATAADPLGERSEAREGKDVSERMFVGVAVGAAGMVPFMIGSAMLKFGFVRKMRKSQAVEIDRHRSKGRAGGARKTSRGSRRNG